jgi:hypothetical protein
MAAYDVDVKTTHLTGSGDVFAGPARVLGIYYCSEGALGTIEIRDGAVGATVLGLFDVPTGSASAGEPVVYQIDVPGNGIYCPNGAYAKLTGGVDKVTVFYG